MHCILQAHGPQELLGIISGLWLHFEASIVKRVSPQQNSGQIARTESLPEPCRKKGFFF